MVSFKPELRFPLNRNCGFHSPDRRCNQPRITQKLQTLQASRPAGRGIWIVKEIPKKTRDLFDLLGVAYPQKHVKN